MAQFILREGFEHQTGQVFFTLVLIDSAGRDIHSERLSVPAQANSSVVDTVLRAAANRFPDTNVETLIRDAVTGLTP